MSIGAISPIPEVGPLPGDAGPRLGQHARHSSDPEAQPDGQQHPDKPDTTQAEPEAHAPSPDHVLDEIV